MFCSIFPRYLASSDKEATVCPFKDLVYCPFTDLIYCPFKEIIKISTFKSLFKKCIRNYTVDNIVLIKDLIEIFTSSYTFWC